MFGVPPAVFVLLGACFVLLVDLGARVDVEPYYILFHIIKIQVQSRGYSQESIPLVDGARYMYLYIVDPVQYCAGDLPGVIE